MKYSINLKSVRARVILPLVIVLAVAVGGLFLAPRPAAALPNLTIEPLTWNIIGLDSNLPAAGPNNFPVGARVCNIGPDPATNVVVDFVWDDGKNDYYPADLYINLRSGSLSVINVGGLASGACYDAYFEAAVERTSAAYDKMRAYHITAVSAETALISTPTPRYLFVEHLVSQSRNYSIDVRVSSDGSTYAGTPNGGTMTLLVGNTYWIKLVASTATQGYQQIESFINFPNTIFQVLSVNSTYSAETSANMTPPYDMLYGDACVWQNNPASPNYRSCLSTGKAGGDITVTYQVKILTVPSGVNPEPLNTMIYDFSGSSFHYNSDYSVNARYAYILAPSAVTLSKSFVPSAIQPAGLSTLAIRISNPAPDAITGVNFVDDLPDTTQGAPGNMTVANPAKLTYTNCGVSPSPASLSGGEGSISFSNITLPPNGTCVIKVDVVTSAAGTYPNTTGHLYINGTVDTGNFASASLSVSANSIACVNGIMARWTVPNGTTTTNPPDTGGSTTLPAPGLPTNRANNVGSATVNLFRPADSVIGTKDGYSGAADYYWSVYGYKTAPTQYIQFAINTKNYSQVGLSFAIQNTNRSNGPKLVPIQYFDGTNWITSATLLYPGDFPDTNWRMYPATGVYDFTGLTSTSGLTYFRIGGSDANNDNASGGLYFDQITFTGCSYSPPPTINKSFGTDPIVVNQPSLLTFNIANTATTPYDSVSLSGVTFTDVLPAGLVIVNDATHLPATTCTGGTLTAVNGTSTITLAGASVGFNSTCTVSVYVTGIQPGFYENVSGYISSTQSGTNRTSGGYARDTILVIAPPYMTKSFGDAAILTNGTTSLSFLITNPNLGTDLNGVAFTDNLPAGLVVAAPSELTSDCGGDITASGSTVSLSNVTLPASGSCAISLNVQGITAGPQDNSATVSSTNGGTGNTATASLLVKAASPALTLQKQVGASATGPWYSYLGIQPNADVYYKFSVENTGDVPLSSINITDPLVNTSGCAWPSSLPVAVANNENHIASCVVGPVTAQVGSHPNTAYASGTYNSTPYNSANDTATYDTTGLTLDKSVAPDNFSVSGNNLIYTYVVTNPGTNPRPGPVLITDNKTTVTCPNVNTVGNFDGNLDPGESLTCSAVYPVSVTDTAEGWVENIAVAMAGGVESNTDSAQALNADYGDLPNGYFNTLKADNGARHIISAANKLFMGPTVTGDANGTENLTAAADSSDDGVVRMQDFVNGTEVNIGINLSTSTFRGDVAVGIWIDWNNDEVFDPATDFFSCTGLETGSIENCAIDVPDTTLYPSLNSVFARVRVFDQDNLPGGSLDAGDYVGTAYNGEVEDYYWDFRATAVEMVALSATSQPAFTGTFIWLSAAALLGAGSLLAFKAWRKRA